MKIYRNRAAPIIKLWKEFNDFPIEENSIFKNLDRYIEELETIVWMLRVVSR